MSESISKPETESPALAENAENAENAESTESAESEMSEQNRLNYEVVSFCDDFYQFNEECAFLCDAFAAIAREPECISENTIRGFDHTSKRIKDKVSEFNDRIMKIDELLPRKSD